MIEKMHAAQEPEQSEFSWGKNKTHDQGSA